jgi:hypothetical protein
MSSCCLFEKPEVKIEYVDVIKEVAVHVEPPPKYEPLDLPIFYLDIIMPNAENVDKETAEAYYKSVIILIGEVKKRDNDLNAYRLIKPEEK